jgi:hypothetical protein
MFSFDDPDMEQKYRQYFTSTTVTRSKPVLYYFWLPMVGSMRILWLVCLLIFPYNISFVEFFVLVMRIFIFIVAAMLYRIRWSESSMARLGSGTLWLIRMFAMVVGLQQLGANHNDPQVMTALIGYICVCGLGVPNFAEYLIIAVLLALVRPMHLYLSSQPEPDLAQQSLFQHALILTLGVSITFTVHSDCRRDWLRSSSASAPNPAPRTRCRHSHSPTQPDSAADAVAAADAAAERRDRVDDGLEEGEWDSAAQEVSLSLSLSRSLVFEYLCI